MEFVGGKVSNGGATPAGTLCPSEWNQVATELNNIIECSGQTPSSTDLRQLKKAIGTSVLAGSFMQGGGVADTYTADAVAPAVDPASLVDGMLLRMIVPVTNTGDSTLNAFGLGVLPITQDDGITPIDPGDMEAGKESTLIYRDDPTPHYELKKEGGGGAALGTNLSTPSITATDITLASSTGTGTTLPSATDTAAGLFSAANHVKLGNTLTEVQSDLKYLPINNPSSTGTFTHTGDSTSTGNHTQTGEMTFDNHLNILDGSSVKARFPFGSIASNADSFFESSTPNSGTFINTRPSGTGNASGVMAHSENDMASGIFGGFFSQSNVADGRRVVLVARPHDGNNDVRVELQVGTKSMLIVRDPDNAVSTEISSATSAQALNASGVSLLRSANAWSALSDENKKNFSGDIKVNLKDLHKIITKKGVFKEDETEKERSFMGARNFEEIHGESDVVTELDGTKRMTVSPLDAYQFAYLKEMLNKIEFLEARVEELEAKS